MGLAEIALHLIGGTEEKSVMVKALAECFLSAKG